ncbi:MAG TPA: polymer-forming cytoskeletal protein [Thermoanaerobaculaceae bacterium]|nr:polymer-forming cytoskeletal protein [Thermoanaerobaculaceae bacterium]
MKKGQTTLNGFLDQGCTIEGDVVFSDLLRVHGQVNGKVSSEHELLVGEGGVVEGEITVGRLVVAGTVRGVIRVAERLVIHATGKVFAEIFAPLLVVDEGGVLEGVVHMARPGNSHAAAT